MSIYPSKGSVSDRNDTADAPLAERVRDIAQIARTTMESQWPLWRSYKLQPNEAISINACYVTSVALQRVLAHLIDDVQWELLHGQFIGCQRIGHRYERVTWGHSWIETPAGGRLIVDITADQFGAEPVIVTYGDDRYCSASSGESYLTHRDTLFVETWTKLILDRSQS